MQASDAQLMDFSVDDDDRSVGTASRAGAMSWVVALFLVAVPLPAFAESGPGENIAIALSSDSIGGQIGKVFVPATVPTAIGDVPIAETDGLGAGVAPIKLRPRGALLPMTGQYKRFSYATE